MAEHQRIREPKEVICVASNQEEAIKRALNGGDEGEVQKAYKDYYDSMNRHSQTPKPLSDFRR